MLRSQQTGWIGVFRALQLGDMLVAVPALRALRKRCPLAKILLIGLPWARCFAERFSSYIDAFLAFPGYPGMPEVSFRVKDLPGFLLQVQKQSCELLIQMHGTGRLSNAFVAMMGARQVAGFTEPGAYCPNPDTFLRYPVEQPEIWRCLRLMEFLGAPYQGDFLEFPLLAADEQELVRFTGGSLIKGKYICLHPGSRKKEKCWPSQSFARVGDAMAGQGFQVVLTGSEDEWFLAEKVRNQMHFPALNVASSMGIGAMGALIAGSRLLVCNDTGVSHLAAALARPSVVVFQRSELAWHPLDRILNRAVCAYDTPTVDAVLEHVQSLLTSTPSRLDQRQHQRKHL